MLRLLACWVCSLLLSPAVAVAESPMTGAMTIGLQRHSAGTFYVDGALEGYGELNFLVDTGSSYLVINETVLAVLKQAGKAAPGRELSGLMADGSRRVIPTYRLNGLRLGEACWIGDVEAAVIAGNTRPILGMEVLARLAPFTFSADPAQLVLARCQSASAAAETHLMRAELLEPAAPRGGTTNSAVPGAPTE